jgi:FK506-binding protein 1
MQMSLGEKATLHITSDYGYGSQGAGGVIPANADLIFVVELLKIGNKEADIPAENAGGCCLVQ